MNEAAKLVERDAMVRQWVQRCQTADDSQAMEAIVTFFIPLVTHLANKFLSDLRDDLIQEGCMGLMQSVQKFDLAQSIRFSSFAYHYIRGRMLQFLNTKAAIIRHPHGEKIFCKSLDAPVIHDQDTVPLVELLPSRSPSPEDRLIRKDIQTRLHQAMERLSPKEQTIVHHYFWKSATLEEIGAHLGMGRETVRRVGQESLKKIRHRLLQRQPEKGVAISVMVHPRRTVHKKNSVVIVSDPKIAELERFPVINFTISTRQGKKIFFSQDVRLVKQAIQPDQLCVVRVDHEMAIRSIVHLVRLLAGYLGISRKNVIVELNPS
ncbi:MAG: sigma-70 family RNA polymerase sigma factor [Magnetococcales bacterium]|nr:sigma-70 family RNA polymerase sigma factor [Magnetococcales bacterium]MBF0150126.1 sigma-70 family RNA polymerase sigma factor [Magnetococcales bacterium]MBF0172856.1 sigma-70 family RNA polymerase sigma factor [Magnetococcales bacterium]MBF0348083.1 sigma-70 family RNA polymerase sigma factor [Magnetococcales bacterium]MBF0631257.1 sigma-70 family RNA polymerase sigma factor [Magnetococcales bacterium]